MALAATTIWEVESGGDDTNNGGAFDPGQTAGMFTDGAATVADTSAPVFSSASYNFVAGDVGAWLFIASGSNWTPGWYKITAVSANKATLDATLGHGVIALVGTITSTNAQLGPSTATGCATTASPSGATWSIDYSQQAGSQFTYSDLSSTGVGLTASSAGHPIGKQQVGNSIVVTGGTNFNPGRYVLASVSGTTGTFLGAGNLHSAAGTNSDGAGRMGGALASPGKSGAHMVASNRLYIKTGTYTVTSASTNIAAGCWSVSVASTNVEGYDTYRGDLTPVGATGARPTIIASGISTFTLFASSGGGGNSYRSLILDGASLTSSRGMNANTSQCFNVHGQNCTNSVFSGSATCVRCSATGCSSVAPFSNSAACVSCVAYSNTISGFAVATAIACLSYSNSGGSSSGFAGAGGTPCLVNCVAYGNGLDGFVPTGNSAILQNCVAEGNTGAGFNLASTGGGSHRLQHCAGYNNSGGNVSASSGIHVEVSGFITGSATFFVAAGSGDFSLNTTAGGGAALRGAGYPGALPGGLTTGYLDVGVAQSKGRHLARNFRAHSQ